MKKFGYVDSWVIPVPRKHLPRYRRWVKALSQVLRENGALDYFEAAADGAKKGSVTSFPRSVKLKRGEIVILTITTYRSKAHRNRALEKTMSDPRLAEFMSSDPAIFDGARMFWSGFKPFFQL